MAQFAIEFNYDGYTFKGAVSEKQSAQQPYYLVELKTRDQQKYANLIAIPPRHHQKNWLFKSPGYKDVAEIFDEQLLMEISTCIALHIIDKSPQQQQNN